MRGHAHEGLQASVGQRELIDKVSAFTSWANLGSHPASCKLCGPTRQSRAAANCVLDGPMRANCLNITGHEIGPCEGMHTRASRPPWANASSSTRSVSRTYYFIEVGERRRGLGVEGDCSRGKGGTGVGRREPTSLSMRIGPPSPNPELNSHLTDTTALYWTL